MITTDPNQILWDNVYNYEGSEVEKLFNTSSPSDYVVLTPELGVYLLKTLNSMGLDNDICPSDIIISDTVPITDLIIKNELHSDDEDYEINSAKDYTRFLYKNGELQMLYVCTTVNNNTYIDSMQVGIISDNPEGMAIYPYKVWRNSNARRSYEYLENTKSSIERRVFLYQVSEERQILLTFWYAIQILLLNPDISKQDLLRANGKEKIPAVVSGSQNQSGKRKRKAKYMKRLYLNSDFVRTRKEFERHTLCWYVVGHKRHYKNGKETWVKGYWKGPMRHTKKNLDDGRERVLV